MHGTQQTLWQKCNRRNLSVYLLLDTGNLQIQLYTLIGSMRASIGNESNAKRRWGWIKRRRKETNVYEKKKRNILMLQHTHYTRTHVNRLLSITVNAKWLFSHSFLSPLLSQIIVTYLLESCLCMYLCKYGLLLFVIHSSRAQHICVMDRQWKTLSFSIAILIGEIFVHR